MAAQLVAAMRGEFNAENYKDEYREALIAVVEAKVAGKPVELPKPSETPTKIADLMSVLEASVAAAREARTTGSRGAGQKSASAADGKVASIKSGGKRAATKAAAKQATEAPKPERRRKTA
jgi:DNA end-binding protein Ku